MQMLRVQPLRRRRYRLPSLIGVETELNAEKWIRWAQS